MNFGVTVIILASVFWTNDALHATRAAVGEGIVAGGGVALVRAISALEGMKGDNEDQTIGINIVRKSLESPLRTFGAGAFGFSLFDGLMV